MTTYLLDSSIIALLDPGCHPQAPALIDWLDRNGASLYLSAMTIAEIESGVAKLRRNGKTARAAEIAILVATILTDFGHRILPMDTDTARHLARLGEENTEPPIGLPELIIAATACRHGLVILTHNITDFRRLGVKAIDPFVELPADV
jgi:toxin FitB